MRTKRLPQWSGAFACVALLLWCGCQSTEQPAVTPGQVQGPDQEGWNSRITVTSQGRVTAHLQYGHMEKYSQRREVHFDGGIVVDFFNPQGQHTSQLTADGGLLFEENNDVEARGNVVAVSDSGITLRTSSLRWSSRRQKILSEDHVVVTTAQGDTLRGKGFESDPNLKNWSIKQPSGVTQKKLELPQLQGGRPEPAPAVAAPADSGT